LTQLGLFAHTEELFDCYSGLYMCKWYVRAKSCLYFLFVW